MLYMAWRTFKLGKIWTARAQGWGGGGGLIRQFQPMLVLGE